MEKKISVLNLAEELGEKSNISVAVSDSFIRSFFDVIAEGLAQDGLVKIKGWGTFKLSAVKDRESVDVTTGERILIKGYRKVSFLPESALKELINKPFSQFETTELSEDFPIEDETVEVETPTDEEVVEPVEAVSVLGIADLPESIEEKAEEPCPEPEKEESEKEEPEREPENEGEPEEPLLEEPAETIVEETIVEPVEEVNSEKTEEIVEETAEETAEKPTEESIEDTLTEDEKKEVVKEKKPRKSWKYWLPIFLLVLISACLYIYIAFGDGFSKPKFSFKKTNQTEGIQVQPIEFDEVAQKLKNVLDTQPAAEEKKEEKPKAEPKAEPKTEPKAEPKAEPQKEPVAEPAKEPEVEPVSETKAETEVETEVEPKVEPKAEPESKSEPKAESKSKDEPKVETKAEPAPEVKEVKPAPKEEVKTAPKEEVKSAPKEEVKPVQTASSSAEKSLKDVTLADTTAYSILGTKATHTIQDGETIIKLAQKYYGDKRLWPYIVVHNGMKNPNNVVVGKTINIPDLKPIN